jgi:hypothetical protein
MRSQSDPTWDDERIAVYRQRHPLGTMARLAIELALNIAARRHDIHLIGRQHLRDGFLTWRPHKTHRTTNKVLTVRVMPELAAALDAMPRIDFHPQRARATIQIGRILRRHVCHLVQAGWSQASGWRRWQDAQLSQPKSQRQPNEKSPTKRAPTGRRPSRKANGGKGGPSLLRSENMACARIAGHRTLA